MIDDLRLGVRGLLKNPGFAAIAIATLAVGIGLNTAVFTVTNAVLFKGRPLIARSDRILYVQSPRFVSYPDFQDWRNQTTTFAGMAAVTGLDGRIVSDDKGHRERHSVSLVSANAFRLLGLEPIVGRDFLPADEAPGSAPVVILGYSLWQRWYEKDPAVVGRRLRINDVDTTVIGVMPLGFTFPDQQELWTPLVPTPRFQRREARNLWFVFGRLAEGASVASARAEMTVIGQRLASAYPQTNQGVLPIVRGAPDHIVGPNARVLYASLWGAVGFVLLIACANLANLLLARAIGRSREMSIRIALGAGRWRIVRQLLVESVLLSVGGGALGWWLAREGVQGYALFAIPAWKQSWFDFAIDYRALAYLATVSVGTGLLFGLAPALRLAKTDVHSSLKDGGRGASGGRRSIRLSALLVTGQVALAVVLLASAGVMVRSFWKVYAANLGVSTEDVVTMGVFLNEKKYPSAEATVAFFDALTARVQAIPGVESVAIAWSLPTDGTAHFTYEVAGAPLVADPRRPMLSALTIGPHYFQTLRASVIFGREFNDADGRPGHPVVLVNERFAATVWPGEPALGKRLRLFDGNRPGEWLTVVGVASNIVQDDATRQMSGPLIYLPHQQRPERSMWVLARVGVPAERLTSALRREVLALDSNPPDFEPDTLTNRLKGNYQSRGVNGLLFLICGAIALLLASVGLYAVVAHTVTQRAYEMGIRMALGASSRHIRALVFKRGMFPLASGLTIGLAGSVAVTRLLMSELVGVSAVDPVSLLVTSAILILSAALGCWMPARRAIRVDALSVLTR